MDISEFIKEFELGCSKVKRKDFKKNETIINYSDNTNMLCILVSGVANLVKYDYDGNKFVTERFYKNSIFSDIFYTFNNDVEYIVEAKEPCCVLLFPYENFSEKCQANCAFHKNLLDFFPNLTIHKIVSLTSRIEILSRKSTREKLLTYFNILSKDYRKIFCSTLIYY